MTILVESFIPAAAHTLLNEVSRQRGADA